MEDGGDQLTSLCDMSLRQADAFQGDFELIDSIRNVITNGVWLSTNRASRTKVTIDAFVHQMQVLPLLWRSTRDEVVKYMEIPLS
jgi:hypothetical protein